MTAQPATERSGSAPLANFLSRRSAVERRDKVTVRELEDLTNLAEELDFESIWTLDRIVIPEASDREELQYSFGMMEALPKSLPVSSRGEWFQAGR